MVVLFLLVEVGQLVRRLILFLVRQLNRIAPRRVSAVIAVLLVVGLTVAILNGVVARFAMHTLNKTFAAVNNEEDPDNPAPKSQLRSGGPGSLVTWAVAGHPGPDLRRQRPDNRGTRRFNGAPAVEPIRVYAGLGSANGIKATAALAATELERAGGLKRKVVAVATTTGTGWINEAEAGALEYMFNGDTATV